MTIIIGMVNYIRPWSAVVAAMTAIAIMRITSAVAAAVIPAGLRVSCKTYKETKC
jgi:hypothetical protein